MTTRKKQQVTLQNQELPPLSGDNYGGNLLKVYGKRLLPTPREENIYRVNFDQHP